MESNMQTMSYRSTDNEASIVTYDKERKSVTVPTKDMFNVPSCTFNNKGDTSKSGKNQTITTATKVVEDVISHNETENREGLKQSKESKTINPKNICETDATTIIFTETLEISGIVEQSDEDLLEKVFLETAKVGVALDARDVDYIFRVGNQNFDNTRPRPIVLKFRKQGLNNIVMNAAKQHDTLHKSDDILLHGDIISPENISKKVRNNDILCTNDIKSEKINESSGLNNNNKTVEDHAKPNIVLTNGCNALATPLDRREEPSNTVETNINENILKSEPDTISSKTHTFRLNQVQSMKTNNNKVLSVDGQVPTFTTCDTKINTNTCDIGNKHDTNHQLKWSHNGPLGNLLPDLSSKGIDSARSCKENKEEFNLFDGSTNNTFIPTLTNMNEVPIKCYKANKIIPDTEDLGGIMCPEVLKNFNEKTVININVKSKSKSGSNENLTPLGSGTTTNHMDFNTLFQAATIHLDKVSFKPQCLEKAESNNVLVSNASNGKEQSYSVTEHPLLLCKSLPNSDGVKLIKESVKCNSNKTKDLTLLNVTTSADQSRNKKEPALLKDIKVISQETNKDVTKMEDSASIILKNKENQETSTGVKPNLPNTCLESESTTDTCLNNKHPTADLQKDVNSGESFSNIAKNLQNYEISVAAIPPESRMNNKTNSIYGRTNRVFIFGSSENQTPLDYSTKLNNEDSTKCGPRTNLLLDKKSLKAPCINGTQTQQYLASNHVPPTYCKSGPLSNAKLTFKESHEFNSHKEKEPTLFKDKNIQMIGSKEPPISKDTSDIKDSNESATIIFHKDTVIPRTKEHTKIVTKSNNKQSKVLFIYPESFSNNKSVPICKKDEYKAPSYLDIKAEFTSFLESSIHLANPSQVESSNGDQAIRETGIKETTDNNRKNVSFQYKEGDKDRLIGGKGCSKDLTLTAQNNGYMTNKNGPKTLAITSSSKSGFELEKKTDLANQKEDEVNVINLSQLNNHVCKGNFPDTSKKIKNEETISDSRRDKITALLDNCSHINTAAHTSQKKTMKTPQKSCHDQGTDKELLELITPTEHFSNKISTQLENFSEVLISQNDVKADKKDITSLLGNNSEDTYKQSKHSLEEITLQKNTFNDRPTEYFVKKVSTPLEEKIKKALAPQKSGFEEIISEVRRQEVTTLSGSQPKLVTTPQIDLRKWNISLQKDALDKVIGENERKNSSVEYVRKDISTPQEEKRKEALTLQNKFGEILGGARRKEVTTPLGNLNKLVTTPQQNYKNVGLSPKKYKLGDEMDGFKGKHIIFPTKSFSKEFSMPIVGKGKEVLTQQNVEFEGIIGGARRKEVCSLLDNHSKSVTIPQVDYKKGTIIPRKDESDEFIGEDRNSGIIAGARRKEASTPNTNYSKFFTTLQVDPGKAASSPQNDGFDKMIDSNKRKENPTPEVVLIPQKEEPTAKDAKGNEVTAPIGIRSKLVMTQQESGSDLHTSNGETEDPNCAVCQAPCQNKAHPDTCRHLFCFICLSTWSQVKSECPLCKRPFKSIIYNIRAGNQHDKYLLNQNNANLTEERNRVSPTPEPTLPSFLNGPSLHHTRYLEPTPSQPLHRDVVGNRDPTYSRWFVQTHTPSPPSAPLHVPARTRLQIPPQIQSQYCPPRPTYTSNSFQCDVCGRVCASKAGLMSHQRMHARNGETSSWRGRKGTFGLPADYDYY